MADVIDLDERRACWLVARVKCRECGKEATSAVHKEAPYDALECPECDKMSMAVTHWLGPNNEWRLRLELVQ